MDYDISFEEEIKNYGKIKGNISICLKKPIKCVGRVYYEVYNFEKNPDLPPGKNGRTNHILIEKIDSYLDGFGIGSILLEELEKRAYCHEILRITGRFGPREDKVEDLKRFYLKNGYSVDLETEKIEKNLVPVFIDSNVEEQNSLVRK